MAWESIISSVKSLIRFFILTILFLGCAPKPPKPVVVPVIVKKLPVPYALRAEVDSHKATLFWSIDRSPAPTISGYNIYIGDISAIKDSTAWMRNPGAPYNQAPYPGDTGGDINRESLPLEKLTNGITYLAMVRTVGPDGRESESSNLASFRPLAHGEFVISCNHEASDGGFNFETELSVPGRDPRSDIYMYATENKIGLSSPNRLGAGFRKSKFSIFGDVASDNETILISKGSRIVVKCRYGRAEITIDDILGKYPDAMAKVSYIFYPDNP